MLKSGFRFSVTAAAVLVLAACAVPQPQPRVVEPRRTMGVTQGPELVFGQPVAEVVPALAGATATGRNGRVGGELVFWSYRLADGRDVLLHACADVEGVDCPARTQRICLRGAPQALETGRSEGDVRHRQCQAIAQAAPGELYPGCTDSKSTQPIVLGLAACP